MMYNVYQGIQTEDKPHGEGKNTFNGMYYSINSIVVTSTSVKANKQQKRLSGWVITVTGANRQQVDSRQISHLSAYL